MRIDVITIFPGIFAPFLDEAFPALAQERGLVEFGVHDLRDWTQDRHRSVDDAPYGGGPGMVMRPEPLVAAIEALAGPKGGREALVIALTPQGARLEQARLGDLAARDHLVLVCGRYEGFDERALELGVDLELSVGDYVLSGGEVPAMALIEGVVRLVPGVLGNPESLEVESFRGDLLEGPHYTRPPLFRDRAVPDVLRSGDHAAIARWREQQAGKRTRERRPDLVRRSLEDES